MILLTSKSSNNGNALMQSVSCISGVSLAKSGMTTLFNELAACIRPPSEHKSTFALLIISVVWLKVYLFIPLMTLVRECESKIFVIETSAFFEPRSNIVKLLSIL